MQRNVVVRIEKDQNRSAIDGVAKGPSQPVTGGWAVGGVPRVCAIDLEAQASLPAH